MRRLGYTRYVAQGGDVGSGVTDAMARQAPEGLVGVHINLFLAGLLDPGPWPATSEERTRGTRAVETFTQWERLPPGAGHTAADDRLRAAGFTRRTGRLDAGPRHRQLLQDLPRVSDDEPSGNLTRDQILDNITLYWLTGTGASAARSYWEYGQDALSRPARSPPGALSRSASPPSPARSAVAAQLGRSAYPNLMYYNESTRAATSPPGRSPRSSPKRCAQPSDRCANRSWRRRRAPFAPSPSSAAAHQPKGPHSTNRLGWQSRTGGLPLRVSLPLSVPICEPCAVSLEVCLSAADHEVRPAVGPATGWQARALGQGIHGRDRRSESGILMP